MELPVTEAARLLDLDPSRVRALLRSGALPGRRVSSGWLVRSEELTALAQRRPLPGRPLAPQRAWALIDLLEGGAAAWLSPVARSQTRRILRNLDHQPAARWRALLRARSTVRRCQGHPSAVRQLLTSEQVRATGELAAAAAGLDLVATVAVPQVYVAAEQWSDLAARLRLHETSDPPDVVVRLPDGRWPFAGGVGRAALAADLLESVEPRAVRAGLAQLQALVQEHL